MTTAAVLLPAPDRPLTTVGDGRYLLDPAGGPAAPRPGRDTRLGRRVLVQTGVRATPSTRLANRLVRVIHPGLAPLLDAGEDRTDGGVLHAWTVFPATDWPTLEDLDLGGQDLARVAALAAWVAATVAAAQAAGGRSLTPRGGDVVVDPAWLSGATVVGAGDGCPVRWMPSLAEGDDALPTVLAPLLAGRRGRERRRLTVLLERVVTPAGRPRALRHLAELAGLDPRVLGLQSPAPHHAGWGRRPSGRRPSVGTVPTAPRRDVTCASAEAFS